MMKRVLSFVLSIVMVFSMLPLQSFADELPEVEIIETQAEEPAVETTEVSEEVTEAAEETTEVTEEATEAVEETTEATEEAVAQIIARDAAMAYSGTCGENLTWTLDENTLTISGTGDMDDFAIHESPWYEYRYQIQYVVIEDGVTSIGNHAFAYLYSVKSIELPETVTRIDSGAFCGCSSLLSITIPQGVTAIESYTFMECSSLTSITVPDSVTQIGAGAFEYCSALTDIASILDNVSSIADSAFSYCNSLKSVVIPEGHTSIGRRAFEGCANLTSITIPDSVTSIGQQAFSECTSLSGIRIPKGLTIIEEETFWYCPKLASVEIPSGVRSIEDSAFQGCAALTSIVLPNSVKQIGQDVFYNCTKLEAVTLSSSLTELSYSAFQGCTSLKNIVLPRGITKINDSAFRDCSSLSAIQIPDTVEEIGGKAFSGCTSLTTIEIPDSVTFLGGNVFEGCTGFTAMDLPDKITYIGAGTFKDCSNLTDIVLPSEIWMVTDNLFENCTALKNIVIPEKVTTIGEASFVGCINLKTVDLLGDITSIGTSAFEGCTALESLVLPDSLEKIDYAAFSGCGKLGEIVVPASVMSIGYGVFQNCTGLKTITFEGAAPTNGADVFDGVAADAYYPENDESWTETVRASYGGTINWIPYTPESDYAPQSVLEEAVLEAMRQGTGVELYENVRLETDYEIPADIWFDLHAAILVPDGVTLTVRGDFNVENDGALYVDEGGHLVISHSIWCYGNGTVEIEGTYDLEGSIYHTYQNGEITTTINGVDREDMGLRFFAESKEEFWEAAELMDRTNYGAYLLVIHCDLVFTRNWTIPENCRVAIERWSDTVTISYGVTLTNNGIFQLLWEDNLLQNNGTIFNNGHFYSRGTVVNSGSFYQNIRGSSVIDGIWRGKNPVRMNEQYIRDLVKAGSNTVFVPRGVNLVIENDFELTGNYLQLDGNITIPDGVTLTLSGVDIMYYGSILIEEGGTLESQEIWFQDGGGKFENHGTFNGPFVSSQYLNGAFTGEVTGIPMDQRALWICTNGSNEEFFNALDIIEEHDFGIYFVDGCDGLTPNQPVTLPENRYINIEGDITLEHDFTIPASTTYQVINWSTLTVGEGATMTIDGTLEAYSNALHNNGQINVNGSLWLANEFLNNGNVTIGQDAALLLSKNAKAKNNGNVYAYRTDSCTLNGKWEGNPIQFWTEKYLQAQIDAGNTHLEVPKGIHLTIEKDFTIPETVYGLNIYGGITVSNGATMKYMGEIYLNGKNASLTVEKGGCLETFGVFIWLDGTVRIDGELDGFVCINYDQGQYRGTVTGVGQDQQGLRFFVYNEEDLREAARIMTEENYCTYYTLIEEDVTITGDLTLPTHCLYHLEADMTINEGCTLVNNGGFQVHENNILNNNGIIENNGEFYVFGTMNNYGEFYENVDSVLDRGHNYAWNGNDTIRNWMFQWELEKAMEEAAENGEMYELHRGVILDENMTLNTALYIGEDGHLVIPEGLKLTVNDALHLEDGGKLTVHGSLVNNNCIDISDIEREGFIRVYGSYTHGKKAWFTHYVWQNRLVEVYGIPEKYQSLNVNGLTEELLPWVTSLTQYNWVDAYIAKDMTLDGALTVPANMALGIVPAGDEHSTVLTLTENAALTIDGILVVNMMNGQSCTLVNNGQVIIRKGGQLNTHGKFLGNAPVNNGGRIYPAVSAVTILGGDNYLIDNRQYESMTLKPVVTSADTYFADNVLQYVTWTSSNTAVVNPAEIFQLEDGGYRIPFAGVGKTKLTATAIDGSGKSYSVNLEVEHADWSPRLSANKVTINSLMDTGADVVLMPAHGNTIEEVWLDNSSAQNRFELDYNAASGILNIDAKAYFEKNQTVNTVLYARCSKDGETYSYNLSITIKNVVPKLTIKQTAKMDLFYADSEAPLSITVAGAEDKEIILTGTKDFDLDKNGCLIFTEEFKTAFLKDPKLKPDITATVKVHPEGCRADVWLVKDIKISTTTAKVSLTAKPSSTTIHTALSDSREVILDVYNKNRMDLSACNIRVDSGFVESWKVDDSGSLAVTVKDSETKGGKVDIYLRHPSWLKEMKVTAKISINTKAPTVKLDSTTLNLSNAFTDQTASTYTTLSHANLTLDGFTEFICDKAEAAKLKVFWSAGRIVAEIPDSDNAPAKGTYTFKAYPIVEGKTLEKAVSVKVKVSSDLPKVSLGRSSINLNVRAAGKETAEIPLKMTNKTGFDLQITDVTVEEEKLNIRFEDGVVKVSLKSGETGKHTVDLTPVVKDDRGTAISLAALKLTITAQDKAVSISQSAKGKLDSLNPKSEIVYTISKLSNILGMVEDVKLKSGEEDNDLFELSELGLDAKGKQFFGLRLKDVTYSTKTTYKVKLTYTVAGQEVSNTVKVKVTQGKVKFNAPAVNYYLSQQQPLNVLLSMTAPENARIHTVTVNEAKTSAALLKDMIGTLQWTVNAHDAELPIIIQNPEHLTYGKTYKLVLDVVPCGMTSDSKPTQVTVNIRVAK